MIELIILYILLKKPSNIYEIRKYIEQNFSLFYKVSLGTVHPALNRLLQKKQVDLSKHITEGGQRKSTYTITSEGITAFNKLLVEELPDNPALANQLIDFKGYFLCNHEFSDELKSACVQSINRYLQVKKTDYEKSIKSMDSQDEYAKYLGVIIKDIDNKIKFIERL